MFMVFITQSEHYWIIQKKAFCIEDSTQHDSKNNYCNQVWAFTFDAGHMGKNLLNTRNCSPQNAA